MRRMSAKTFVLVLLLALIAAVSTDAIAAKPPKRAKARCSTTRSVKLENRTTAYAGVAMQPVSAFRKPGRYAFARFQRLNDDGAPTVFRAYEKRVGRLCGAMWYHVYLPTRPNMKTA